MGTSRIQIALQPRWAHSLTERVDCQNVLSVAEFQGFLDCSDLGCVFKAPCAAFVSTVGPMRCLQFGNVYSTVYGAVGDYTIYGLVKGCRVVVVVVAFSSRARILGNVRRSFLAWTFLFLFFKVKIRSRKPIPLQTRMSPQWLSELRRLCSVHTVLLPEGVVSMIQPDIIIVSLFWPEGAVFLA